jgi:NAD(P)-dependent dehydrogenase (short-subunit alcohol dehydrogenase family)
MEDGFSAYAASKAALNMAARHMDAELKRKGRKTSIFCLHPGEVKTDMANVELGWEVEGQMTPQESVSQCIDTIESKTYDDSGTFWTWENKVSLLSFWVSRRRLTCSSLCHGDLWRRHVTVFWVYRPNTAVIAYFDCQAFCVKLLPRSPHSYYRCCRYCL